MDRHHNPVPFRHMKYEETKPEDLGRNWWR
jgi:hypothetical protein